MKLLILSFFYLLSYGVPQDSTVVTKTGKATYYATRFEGKRTTSGQVYRAEKFTAAHKTLPFGTIVRVINLLNGKTVDVIINDRGPYGKGMIIDVSKSAAKELGMFGKGSVSCSISYLKP